MSLEPLLRAGPLRPKTSTFQSRNYNTVSHRSSLRILTDLPHLWICTLFCRHKEMIKIVQRLGHGF